MDGYQSRPDGLQIRYSPGGGIDTGTGTEDVGDFTVLLLDLPYITNSSWMQHQVELPGPGRIAIRRYLNLGGINTPYGTYLRLDSLSVSTPVAPLRVSMGIPSLRLLVSGVVNLYARWPRDASIRDGRSRHKSQTARPYALGGSTGFSP